VNTFGWTPDNVTTDFILSFIATHFISDIN